ncbi:type II restriction endonuclease [uncultured Celeribacter sp.]|uniref:type II restriction endonuclease n=1 Tax=uncultured Celeribacter sp. TaxID=1303376 RepID=UPI002AA81EEA|nr:type II restriction endonuclease [uncultured Celeribacter sp.]
MPSIQETLTTELDKLADSYKVCGIVDQTGCVYPLGADTKVLSTIFELVSRPAVYATAKALGYECLEPTVQNHYPDFTFHKGLGENGKIAIDVKTTYRRNDGDKFGYTLGGYTSFIRPGNERKNIVFPFDQYSEHWVIGFVYNRIGTKKAQAEHSFSLDQLVDIPLPFENVEVFVQEKWRISSDRAGSGNTTNIGSINGTIEDFRAGNGPFKDEDEFLEYWRSYGRTKADRGDFSNIGEFRRFKQG